MINTNVTSEFDVITSIFVCLAIFVVYYLIGIALSLVMRIFKIGEDVDRYLAMFFWPLLICGFLTEGFVGMLHAIDRALDRLTTRIARKKP